jgi:hypothetical protein
MRSFGAMDRRTMERHTSALRVHLNDDATFVPMRRGAPQSLPHRFELERHNRIDGRKHSCGCGVGDISQRPASTGTRSREDVTRPADSRSGDAIADASKNGQDSDPTERAIADEAFRADDRYENAICPKHSSRSLLDIATTDQVEHAVNASPLTLSVRSHGSPL